MCGRFISVCLVLILCLVSTSYGTVTYPYIIGDWEDGNMDGWDNGASTYWGTPPFSTAELIPGQTIGVTHGIGSLGAFGQPIGSAEGSSLYDPANPNLWGLMRYNPGEGLPPVWPDLPVAAFTGADTFAIDVTRLGADWSDGGNSTFAVCVLGDGFWYMQKGYAPYDGVGDTTMTLEMDISDEVLGTPSSPSWRPGWFQIIIFTESTGFTTGGTFYFDNARFIPEPASALIIALGATIISLRRKKC
jgi:hypothetical protein